MSILLNFLPCSDDDLEPFDMSHDQEVSKVKPPRYVRDCMDGLLAAEQPERTEACLREAEKLICTEAELTELQVLKSDSLLCCKILK